MKILVAANRVIDHNLMQSSARRVAQRMELIEPKALTRYRVEKVPIELGAISVTNIPPSRACTKPAGTANW